MVVCVTRVCSVGDLLEIHHTYVARGPWGLVYVCMFTRRSCHVHFYVVPLSVPVLSLYLHLCLFTSYLCHIRIRIRICIYTCHVSICISISYPSVSVSIIISKYLSHQDLVRKRHQQIHWLNLIIFSHTGYFNDRTQNMI